MPPERAAGGETEVGNGWQGPMIGEGGRGSKRLFEEGFLKARLDEVLLRMPLTLPCVQTAGRLSSERRHAHHSRVVTWH